MLQLTKTILKKRHPTKGGIFVLKSYDV